jgi:hypothetical protein
MAFMSDNKYCYVDVASGYGCFTLPATYDSTPNIKSCYKKKCNTTFCFVLDPRKGKKKKLGLVQSSQ